MAHYFSLNSGALFLAFNGVFYIADDNNQRIYQQAQWCSWTSIKYTHRISFSFNKRLLVATANYHLSDGSGWFDKNPRWVKDSRVTLPFSHVPYPFGPTSYINIGLEAFVRATLAPFVGKYQKTLFLEKLRWKQLLINYYILLILGHKMSFIIITWIKGM